MGLGLQAAFAGDALDQAITKMIADQRQRQLDDEARQRSAAQLSLQTRTADREDASAALNKEQAIRGAAIEDFKMVDGRWVPNMTPGAPGATAVPQTPPTMKIPGVAGTGAMDLVPRSQAETTALSEEAKRVPYDLTPGSVRFDKNNKPVAGVPAATKARTDADLDVEYQDIVAKKDRGEALTPEEESTRKAFEQRKTLASTTAFNLNQPNKDTARSDRSFQSSMKQLDTMRKPVQDQAERLAKVRTSLDDMTPTGDAFLAPEMMVIMAGGAGSGVRLTQSEIDSVVNGRSHWESLKAAVNKWSLNPKSALSVNPDQRQDMHNLIKYVSQRNEAQLKALDDAENGLLGSYDVDEHRKILAGVKTALEPKNAWADQKFAPEVETRIQTAVSGGYSREDAISMLKAAGVIK